MEVHKLDVTETLDTSGLSCPLPVLKTKKAIKGLAVGDLLKVISTDPGSKKDIPSWARVTGQEIIDSSEDGDKYIFVVKKLK
jgi:tRNA 2-thiouridine synthesizing protein A